MPTAITIDPSKNLSNLHAKLLQGFLASTQGPAHWRQSLAYAYTDPDTNIDYAITLRYSLFRRELATRDAGLPYRYEGYDRKDGNIAETDKSKVKALMPGVIVPQASACFFKPKALDKRRVVKVIELSHNQRRRDSQIQALNHEIEMANVVGQLGVKPLTIVGDFALITMKRAAGVPLSQIIAAGNLRDRERYQLSYSLLYYAQKLLAEKGIIHLDLKPDNIIVDMTQVPYKITFIDFGNATRFNEVSDDPRGTPAYACPGRYLMLREPNNYQIVFNNNILDVFSLGKILFEIWSRIDNQYSCDTSNFADVNEAALQLDKLFTGTMPPDCAAELDQLIRGMLTLDFQQRISLIDNMQRLAQCAVRFEVDAETKMEALASVNKFLDPSHSNYQHDEHKRHALTKLKNLLLANGPLFVTASMAKVYRHWEQQPCLVHADKSIRTNADVIEKHKNIFKKLFSSQPTNTDEALIEVIVNPRKLAWIAALEQAIERLNIAVKPDNLVFIEAHLQQFRQHEATTKNIDTVINAVVMIAGPRVDILDDDERLLQLDENIGGLYRAMLEFDDTYCTDALDNLAALSVCNVNM